MTRLIRFIAVLGNPTNADAVVMTRPWQLSGTLPTNECTIEYSRMFIVPLKL